MPQSPLTGQFYIKADIKGSVNGPRERVKQTPDFFSKRVSDKAGRSLPE